MKEIKDLQLRFIWGEQWVLGLVLVKLGLHLHKQPLKMIYPQALAASNINTEALSNFVNWYASFDYTFIIAYQSWTYTQGTSHKVLKSFHCNCC